MPSQDLTHRLADAAVAMDMTLESVTGLGDLDRRVVTYYTLSTYSLEHVATFPLLVLKGPMGTGKSTALHVIRAFACRPHSFSLRGMTLAAIRDALGESHFGTAIIEEADQAWKEPEAFEALLSDRYQVASARAALKEKQGDAWVTTEVAYFGATVLHRRVPFGDAALDGRSIIVYFRGNPHRRYEQFRTESALVQDGQSLLKDLSFKPPEVYSLPGVAPRIFDTYKPLLGVAHLVDDDYFPALISERLRLATAGLWEAQADEPHVLVLKALIEFLSRFGASSTTRRLEFRNVRFSALAEIIRHNHQIQLKPRQIGAMLRELGFDVKTSHGVTVVVPTPVALLHACEECGYEDEAIAALKAEMLQRRKG